MNDLDPEQMSLVDQAIRSRRAVPVPPGPPKTAIRAVQAAGAASFHPVRGTVLERIMHMDRRIRLSAAAIFLSVTGLAVWMLLSGGTSVGWADVLERIKQTRTLTCTMTERTTGTAKLFVKEPCQRIELSDGNIVIWNRITGKQVVLRPHPARGDAEPTGRAELRFLWVGARRSYRPGKAARREKHRRASYARIPIDPLIAGPARRGVYVLDRPSYQASHSDRDWGSRRQRARHPHRYTF